jgi:hypothetical protein
VAHIYTPPSGEYNNYKEDIAMSSVIELWHIISALYHLSRTRSTMSQDFLRTVAIKLDQIFPAMTIFLSRSTTALVIGVTVALLVLLYRLALPRPISGIPYNHASARSIFGDIPSMMKWRRDTRETFTWMTEQVMQLNAPMVQVFVKPFSLPWVIVTDARECHDVLTRRSKEFDRSEFTTNVVQPILREHHFPFPSGPKQRAHRALLSDLMTPAFLNEVSAPTPLSR